jgi:hypothetical protein
MKTRGIKGSLLKRAQTATVPSKSGSCEACDKQGQVRYFVAAKLPRFMYLCDEHYLRIRDKLEKALEKILSEEGLF